MSKLYQSWFSKPVWSVNDAALLLYGFNPNEWDHAVPKDKYAKGVEARLASWDHISRVEGFQSLLHDLRCDLIYEVSDERREEEQAALNPNIVQYRI